MSLKDHLRVPYRMVLLPMLRSGAAPLFRLAVTLAGKTGLLAKGAPVVSGGQRHITIVHLSNHVGDTVMLLPMIEALRSAHPAAWIECVVQAPLAAFLSLAPALDRVYELQIDPGQTATPLDELKRTAQILRGYRKHLRRTHPTTCIVPRWGCGFRDLMLAYLLQAPNRVGFASNDFDQSQPPAGYRDGLLTQLVRGAKGMTEPARFLFLVEQAGLVAACDLQSPDLHPNTSMQHIARTVDWPALAARLAIDPRTRMAVVAPGASAPRRMWPIERWAAVIEELHAGGFTVALLTGRSDADIAERLFALIPADHHSRTVLVAGTTSLAESTCLLAHSHMFVGNDSGPGHIAGALGVPCIILFIAAEGADPDGPSAPERVRPMGTRVVCCRPPRTIAPCSDYCRASCAHCILQIQPAEVRFAIRSLIPSSAPAS